MKLFFKGAAFGLALFCACASATDATRPDDHAPIGVMGDHTHHKGEWMLSYRYMLMRMEDNRDGTNRLDDSEVLISGTGDYRVAPTEMDMVMHMLGVMYAPTENLTLMAMIPYVENDMDHVTAMGGAFSTESSDLGDISLTALSSFSKTSPLPEWLWQLGLSFPTGDQDQRDLTPMGNSVLPYPMQIGSGSYNLIAGLGKNVSRERDSFGVQLRGIFPLDKNDDDYKVGNRATVSAWYSRLLNQNFSVSVRGLYEFRDNYSGEDPRYAMAQAINLVPTVDPDLRGGARFDIAVGVNWLHSSGHRLALEYQVPAWQDLDGPQLETDSVLTVGWQLAF